MLYHRDVYMPAFDLPQGTLRLVYGAHARLQATNKVITFLPTSIRTDCAKVIEVETDQTGQPRKVVYRVPLTFEKDLCLAVIVNEGNPFFVKTVWVNDSSDLHGTLDRSKYATK